MYKYSTCNINSQDNIKIIHLGLTVRSFFAKVPRRASGQCSGSLLSSPTTLIFKRIW